MLYSKSLRVVGVLWKMCGVQKKLQTTINHFERNNFYKNGLRPFSTKSDEFVTIHFKLSDGLKKTTKAKVGSSFLDVVLDNNIGIDGFGACEGTLACSTCHLVFSPDVFKNLPTNASDEELDMLDLAYGLTDTSRLGCQITITKIMDGLEVEVPAGVADARS